MSPWQVLELQQQLKAAQHQLRVEEARAGESIRLERDSRDLSDTLSALRAKQQEEHITRLHKPPEFHRARARTAFQPVNPPDAAFERQRSAPLRPMEGEAQSLFLTEAMSSRREQITSGRKSDTGMILRMLQVLKSKNLRRPDHVPLHKPDTR